MISRVTLVAFLSVLSADCCFAQATQPILDRDIAEAILAPLPESARQPIVPPPNDPYAPQESSEANVSKTTEVGEDDSEVKFDGVVLPDLPAGTRIEDGIVRHEVRVEMDLEQATRLWIYRPDPVPVSPRPCVLIAPSGTILIHGRGLSEEDQAEHLPWVHAGFVVVAYHLSGYADPKKLTLTRFRQAATRFQQAEGGLRNGQAAVDYVRKRVPFVDANRLYAVGHSSAATAALYLAAKEKAIQGCVAFMPVVDVAEHLGQEALEMLGTNEIVPDPQKYLRDISPATYVGQIRCPTFIFIADDDSIADVETLGVFAENMRNFGGDVTVGRVPSGGHYQAMIDEGIPLAIQWLAMVDKIESGG